MDEYIEREALLKYPIRIGHYDKEHGNKDFVLGIESVMEYAEALPAADVVEVKHGRWITHRDKLTSCSECHTLGSPQWKGCPVCLARMDGE